MAKKTTPETGQGGAGKGDGTPKVGLESVKASTSDTDIVKMDKDGKELGWDFEDFRVLEGTVLDKLSRRSIDRYFVELGAYRRRLAREKDEAEFGRTPVIEVLGRSAPVRMEVAGLPDYLHPYWAGPEEVNARLRAGYITVDRDRFPEVEAGDSSLGSQRKLRTAKGVDEAILMAVPKDRYDGHVQGMSEQSRENLQDTQASSREKIIEAAGTSSVDPKFRQTEPVKIKVPRGA